MENKIHEVTGLIQSLEYASIWNMLKLPPTHTTRSQFFIDSTNSIMIITISSDS